MFNFFKRNKSRPTTSSNNSNNNNNNIGTTNDSATKLSVNMQLAIERQQASLQQTLELKRKNDVNDREQKDVKKHLHTHQNVAYNDDEDDVDGKNRSPTFVSEHDRTNVRASDTCAPSPPPPRQQNYDQYRDAVRASYSQIDSIEYASRQGGNTPINYYHPNAEKLSPSVVVASSSIKDQKCLTIAGTSSSNAYNSVYEVMGRGRNRNKHRGGTSAPPPTFNPNHNKNIVKNLKSEDENVSKNFNESSGVTCENSNVDLMKFEASHHDQPQNLNISASAVENSEKSASISSENVFHDEDSCSINSQPEYKNDNIATSDEGGETATEATSASEATNIVCAHHEKNENLVESLVASGVKNDEQSDEQQVGAPLQRSVSARRVTFAPSPPCSLASSESDDDDETISDDIFYEAAEVQSDNQRLRILSTVTSHSTTATECARIDEESVSEISECSTSSNNDVVCAKMILSVNESEKLSDNDDNDNNDNVDDDQSDNIKTNAFSSDDTSISSEVESAPKTIKPSYLLVGEDTIALPDIVAETSLLEQHQHHQQHHHHDEM